MARLSSVVHNQCQVFTVFLCLFGVLMTPSRNQATVAQEASFDVATELGSRVKTRMTPEDDPLLRSLEQDFLDLLKKSAHVHDLLKAEELMVITDDYKRRSEYQKAIKILRSNRDAAAIPLMLRFMLIHEEIYFGSRISRDYRDAIAIIAGYYLDMKDMFSSRKYQQFRLLVSEAVTKWWNPVKDNLKTDFREMSKEQLKVVVDGLHQGADRLEPVALGRQRGAGITARGVGEGDQGRGLGQAGRVQVVQRGVGAQRLAHLLQGGTWFGAGG